MSKKSKRIKLMKEQVNKIANINIIDADYKNKKEVELDKISKLISELDAKVEFMRFDELSSTKKTIDNKLFKFKLYLNRESSLIYTRLQRLSNKITNLMYEKLEGNFAFTNNNLENIKNIIDTADQSDLSFFKFYLEEELEKFSFKPLKEEQQEEMNKIKINIIELLNLVLAKTSKEKQKKIF